MELFTKGPVLLVDDDKDSREMLIEELEEYGILTIPYGTGFSALKEINNGLRYKVAIIDVSLPDMDGQEVMEIAKTTNPEALIIAYTGWSGFKHVYADKVVLRATEDDINLADFVNEYLT